MINEKLATGRVLAWRPRESAAAVIRSRLNRISAESRHVLSIASIFGPNFATQDVAALLGASPTELRAALDEAVDAGLVRHGPRGQAFANELVWTTVAASVPLAVREPLLIEVAGVSSSSSDRTPSHPVPAGWLTLTDTERAVAALVSDGLTNRQIAERMFLSPHTVSFHLRKIFRKLHVRSRVDLTRIVIAQRLNPPSQQTVAHSR